MFFRWIFTFSYTISYLDKWECLLQLKIIKLSFVEWFFLILNFHTCERIVRTQNFSTAAANFNGAAEIFPQL